MPGYGLIASPTLYPGQAIHASLSADVEARVSLFIRAYGANDELQLTASKPVTLVAQPDHDAQLAAARPGRRLAHRRSRRAGRRRSAGTLYLDYLTWSGAPEMTFTRPPHNGTLWQRAWIKACSDLNFGWGSNIRICQDEGTGLLIQGEREWSNYTCRAPITPHLAKAAGIAVCVQGMQRYYALALYDDGKARLIKQLDGRQVLADAPFEWKLDGTYELSLTTHGDRLMAAVDGKQLFDVRDPNRPLQTGSIALLIEEGRLDCNEVAVAPA